MKVYSSWRSDRVERHGVYVGCTVGTLSDCGGWVDVGTVRHRMGPDWHTTEAAAEAAQADAIERLGTALLEQAKRLRAAASQAVPA